MPPLAPSLVHMHAQVCTYPHTPASSLRAGEDPRPFLENTCVIYMCPRGWGAQCCVGDLEHDSLLLDIIVCAVSSNIGASVLLVALITLQCVVYMLPWPMASSTLDLRPFVGHSGVSVIAPALKTESEDLPRGR